MSRPKITAQEPSYLSREDVERLLAGIDADFELKRAGGHARDGDITWRQDLIRVALGTGMRRGELLSRRRSHFDPEKEPILICDTASFKTKGHRNRTIHLTGSALEVVQRRSEERTDDLDGPIFTYQNGTAIVPGYASKRFKYYARLARLPEDIHFHSLRHSTGTWLAEAGTNPFVLQQILGHADLKTTQILRQHRRRNGRRRHEGSGRPIHVLTVRPTGSSGRGVHHIVGGFLIPPTRVLPNRKPCSGVARLLALKISEKFPKLGYLPAPCCNLSENPQNENSL